MGVMEPSAGVTRAQTIIGRNEQTFVEDLYMACNQKPNYKAISILLL